MNGLLQRIKEGKFPIEITYNSNAGEITQRTIILLEIQGNYIIVFCLLNNNPHFLIIYKSSRLLT